MEQQEQSPNEDSPCCVCGTRRWEMGGSIEHGERGSELSEVREAGHKQDLAWPFKDGEAAVF